MARSSFSSGVSGFALGRYLANQNVAGVHFGTDIHDTGFVEMLEGFFTDIGNVAGGDFFLAPAWYHGP